MQKKKKKQLIEGKKKGGEAFLKHFSLATALKKNAQV